MQNPTTPFYKTSHDNLSDFIRTSKDRTLAYDLSKKLYRDIIFLLHRCGYQPAQDYLAEQKFWAEHYKVQDKAKTILDAIEDIVTHIGQGRLMGLSLEEIITHDEIYGFFMNCYDEDVILAAKKISAFITDFTSKHPRDEAQAMVEEFIIKIRDTHFSKDWLRNDSLAFSYLVAHAQRLSSVPPQGASSKVSRNGQSSLTWYVGKQRCASECEVFHN